MRSKRRRSLAIITAAALAMGFAGAKVEAQSTAKAVPLVPYRDTETGVALDYPLAWKPYGGQDYFPSFLEQKDGKPRLALTFSPAGNYYAKTTLGDLTFLYSALPATSLAQCRQQGDLKTWVGDATPGEAVIHGVRFYTQSASDAGMSKELSVQLYFTWRKGTCLLFEEDFRTFADGVVPDTRALTAAERKALQRHMDAIVASVRFATP